MTDATPQGAAHVIDARINAARTKLIIDKKLKGTSKPQIESLAQLKTSGERRRTVGINRRRGSGVWWWKATGLKQWMLRK